MVVAAEASRRSSGTRRRRVFGIVGLVLVALGVAIATIVVASLGAAERVTSLWVGATVAADGSAQITEVVDYDFGSHERHGILRDVPGLRTSAPVQVSSPDAPSDVTVEGSFPARIRIGDPDRTMTGQHRYVLTYTLDGVAPGGRLAWDAVGTGWEVGIGHAEVRVVAPADLQDARCVAGGSGSTTSCAIEGPRPGALVARVDGLDAGEGVTVFATAGEPLTAAAALPTPPAQVVEPRQAVAPAVPGVLAGVLALLAGLLTARVLRRTGRERVPTVGVPALGAPGEEARIDLDELAGYATPSSSLPAGLTPAQGGVLLAGGVRSEHKAAWLVGEAVAGTIDLDAANPYRPKEITLVRLGPGDPLAGPVLDRAFRGRQRLTLGRYDRDFAAGWNALGDQLGGWQRHCGLWNAAADRRAGRVRGLGVLAGLVGIGLALLGGWLSAGGVVLPLALGGVGALGLAGIGGALAGAGAVAVFRGWELRVLTPAGSSAWLQVEGLRRFLAQSPPTAVDEAIATGQLGRYTAWALALGEAERWSRLASSVAVPARSAPDARYLRYASYGPVFVSSCSTTSVQPSSSGGGGGGGVGGGAGGGGGGSW